MHDILNAINSAVWGVPLLTLMLGVGLYLSFRLKFIQFRLLPRALKTFWREMSGCGDNKGKSSYRALCTALAATVGTGNLAGVAGAIAIGGPGAVFWIWICAFIGMCTKFAEATLAVRYREMTASGEYTGGPMYIIINGLHKRWHSMAYLYCFFGIVASFGVGNTTQINTVIGGIESVVGTYGKHINLGWRVAIGGVLAIILAIILLGGVRRIGEATERLVPMASIGYVILCVFVLVTQANRLPSAFGAILKGAITPRAITGGVIGSVMQPLRIGVSRGVFTNEAGMGTAAIAHASGDVNNPVQQGLMGIVEVFIDTILICTLTALAILCSNTAIPYGIDTGIILTADAFSSVCGEWVRIPLAVSLCLFAIATILGWGFYGARCAEFLFGNGVWKYFAFLQGVAAIAGAILKTETVWLVADIVNGLMAIPNLIALYLLVPELSRLVKNSA